MERPRPEATPTGGRRPRLALIAASRRRRGAEVQGERIAAGLRTRGWDVDHLALARSEPETPTVDAEPVTHKTTAELGRLDLATIRALRRRLKQGEYDVVLANGSITLRYVAMATPGLIPRSRRGYVSIGEPAYWIRTRAQMLRQQVLMRSMGWILAVSTVTAQQVKRIAGAGCDVTVVHGGVTADFLAVTPRPRSGPLNALFVGSLTDEKNPMSALAAVGKALDAGADVMLRFVGAGERLDDLVAAARRDGLASRVTVAGAKASVVEDYEWADVLVVTSRTEGLPGVILEAGAAGVPTAAFDVGGVSDVIRNGETGCLVPAGDVDALAGALHDLALDEPHRATMADNVRSLVERDFLIDSAVDRYDSALRRHLGP